jgi:DNA repair protein RadC
MMTDVRQSHASAVQHSYQFPRFREIPEPERPRERLARLGAESLSDTELLSAIIGTGSNRIPVHVLAGQLLSHFNGLRSMLEADWLELVAFPGVGRAKAAQIKAAFELGRRVGRLDRERFTVRCPRDVADYLMDRLRFHLKEHFMVLHLDTKNQVIGEEVVSIGSLNASIVHPREIFKTALKRSAASIICAHNHPSGDPAPSREDIEVTARLVEAGKLLGVDVLDHIIIGDNRFSSLKEQGCM